MKTANLRFLVIYELKEAEDLRNSLAVYEMGKIGSMYNFDVAADEREATRASNQQRHRRRLKLTERRAMFVIKRHLAGFLATLTFYGSASVDFVEGRRLVVILPLRRLSLAQP